MPAKLLTRNERTAPPPIPTPAPDDELRNWARQHVERVHRLKLHVGAVKGCALRLGGPVAEPAM